jgi:predicted P-loop ATPase
VQDRIDAKELLSRVDIVAVIDRFVPLKKSGAEYEACCPFHTEDTPSFKVSPAKRFYQCFGCGAHGDAIDFLQEYQQLSFVDACKALGGNEIPGAAGSPVRREVEREKKVSPWIPVQPAPAHAEAPPNAHFKRGLPETVWAYRDAAGAVLGYVYRFRTSTGGKETLPLSWCHHKDSGLESWQWISFPQPRPLYGLDRLAEKPTATVLLVEGEKCADAGHAQLPELAVASWPGGGKAVKKADFSPLYGRKVILWADCDAKREPLSKAEKDALAEQGKAAGLEAGAIAASIIEAQAAKPLLPEDDQPGVKTMAEIGRQLLEAGCDVWNVRIPEPGDKPDGWDIADAVDEGLIGTELANHIRANAVRLAQPWQGEDGLPADDGGHFDAPPAGAGDGSDGGSHWWRRELLRKDGRLVDCRENVYLILRHHPEWRGVLWADEFARKIIKRRAAPWESESDFVHGSEWGEDDDLRLGLWLAQQERLIVQSAGNIAASVGWAARESRCHPVREYLDGLVWDGQPRLDDWLTDFVGVKKTQYTMLVARMFLIGMVARIYRPGCHMRAMPIFEGAQFRGKSTAVSILGGQWYGDTPIDLNSKDAYQLIQGKWLYEIAELDAFNRAESTRIKAFISSREDRFRAPYDRAPKDWPRNTLFFGTTNQDEYFKDQTGNSRYWPLRAEEVDHIDLDGLVRTRDQLFAEAVKCFHAGDRWHPTREEQRDLFEPEQADREIADPWQSMISKWLRGSLDERVTVTEVITDCLKIEPGKIDSARQMSTRVGIAMKRLGWIKKRQSGGSREWYYQRPENWAATEQESNPWG